jgi:hypothetical protein
MKHIEITEDYIDIYHKGEVIVSWSKDEWMEDPETVVPALANAIHLAHSNPDRLLQILRKVGKVK